MTGIVVSDASPLHYLILVGAVDCLPRLFSQVIIPSAVAAELSHPNTPPQVSRWAGQTPSWLKIIRPQVVDRTLNLDAGETEAISLALELGVDSIIIDERKGRLAAAERGLLLIGTIALLERFAREGWVDFDQAIAQLRAAKFRLNERLVTEAKKRLRIPDLSGTSGMTAIGMWRFTPAQPPWWHGARALPTSPEPNRRRDSGSRCYP
jgi:predicted nucleic acid-binding protein